MANPEILRSASVRLIYNNVDISVDVAPFLTQVEFTDGIEKADDLQVTVADDGRWRRSWAPVQGATLKADIILHETGGGRSVLPCGTFVIDEPEYSGPPDVCSIKATSAWITTALRGETKARAWESVSLKVVAGTIAKKAKLDLQYLSSVNPVYSRIDQRFVSDLGWLTKQAHAAGLRVKVSDGKLILFSVEQFDQAAAITTFTPESATKYTFSFGTTGGYSKCVVKWRDASSKKLHVAEFAPADGPKTGQTLRINERCESNADAERIAKSRLQAANRMLNKATLDVPGDTRLLSGLNVQTAGFGGLLDGRWSIEEAKHSVGGSAYSTALTLRRI